MSTQGPEHIDDTVRLLRPPPRVITDALGHNVWMGDVEPLELELDQPISTDPYNSAAPAATQPRT